MIIYSFFLPSTQYDPSREVCFANKKDAIAGAKAEALELTKLDRVEIAGYSDKLKIEKFKLAKLPKAELILRCLNGRRFVAAGTREFVCDIPIPWDEKAS